MRTCPKCFDMNLPTATACKRCGLPFDQTAANFARNCPAGRHVMDPTWTVCAFCKAEGLVTDDMGESMEPFLANRPTPPPPPPRKTLFEKEGAEESGSGGTRSEGLLQEKEPVEVPAGVSPHARTQFEPPPGTVKELAGPPVGEADTREEDWSNVRKTILDDSPAIPLQGEKPMGDASWGGAPSGSAAGGSGGAVKGKTGYGGPGAPQVFAGDQRKIVGILITYTWKPEGQVFPVREGRNWIGRDPGQADIVIEQDETLSSVNSTISFRSKFVIGDKDSMGGTYVNGKPVEELSHPLPNYSKIRTGSTTWTFIAIDPPAVEPPATEPVS